MLTWNFDRLPGFTMKVRICAVLLSQPQKWSELCFVGPDDNGPRVSFCHFCFCGMKQNCVTSILTIWIQFGHHCVFSSHATGTQFNHFVFIRFVMQTRSAVASNPEIQKINSLTFSGPLVQTFCLTTRALTRKMFCMLMQRPWRRTLLFLEGNGNGFDNRLCLDFVL